MRWFDTLFARVLLVQVGIAVFITLLFGLFTLRQQAQMLAHITAPAWATALAPVAQGGWRLPQEVNVSTPVSMLPGPPPADAATLLLYPRLRAVSEALLQQGVDVERVMVSGRTGDSIIWLQVADGGQPRWVGIRSGFEGSDVRERGLVGVAIGLAAILLTAWWLARRILQPVADLRRAMQRFEAEGEPPPPPAAHAPVELRELAQQFADMARERRERDDQRRTMLAAISHDLRSPLGRIRLAAELLPETPDVALRRAAIVRNVRVADRLLGSFIDLARAASEPLTDRVDLRALVTDVAQGDPDVTLVALPPREVWLAPASALGLERAVINLLDNARHHGAAPFELSLHVHGPEAVIGVRDHGPGIAASELAEMLHPFARGEASRQRPGTGLGLSIVRDTVRGHGGQLALSDARPGLRAELHLPLGTRDRG
jgi:two-component system, OmpR family, osmolarity sensor histidine kinase EnvZ